MLIMRRAEAPRRIVSALEVKSPIKELGIARQSAVPITMTPDIRIRESKKICLTRACSPAP